jgi:hypothetical protein
MKEQLSQPLVATSDLGVSVDSSRLTLLYVQKNINDESSGRCLYPNKLA